MWLCRFRDLRDSQRCRRRFQSSVMWHCILWCTGTAASEEFAAAIFTVVQEEWRCFLIANIRGVTCQKPGIFSCAGASHWNRPLYHSGRRLELFSVGDDWLVETTPTAGVRVVLRQPSGNVFFRWAGDRGAICMLKQRGLCCLLLPLLLPLLQFLPSPSFWRICLVLFSLLKVVCPLCSVSF